MKADEFFKLVAEMRKAQSSYFATKRNYPLEAGKYLVQARTLERQVDAVLKQGLEPDEPTAVQQQQNGLFPA